VGAVVGGVASYLFFTERGRVMRQQLEPMLDDLGSELSRFRGTMVRAAGAASEGWKLLNEAMESGSSARYANPRQTSPF
jgi:hypothetical protein